MAQEASNSQEERTPLDRMGPIYRDEFEEAAAERRPYEDRWLAAMRAFEGQYDPDVQKLFAEGQSNAYVRLTRVKVKTMDARMNDMLFPAGKDKNWSIAATDVPDVPPPTKADIQQKLLMFLQNQENQAAAQADQQPRQLMPQDIPDELLEKAEKHWADGQADAMSTQISDHLSDIHYKRKSRRVIHSGNLYGTGWLKGPLTNDEQDVKWIYRQDNGYVATPQKIEKPWGDFVPIWDVYPDMSNQHSDVNGCEYIFQRHVVGKSGVQKLARRKDFMGDRIRQYLTENPKGDAKRRYHEEQIRQIDTDKQQTDSMRKKYELLERWGWIDPDVLMEAGIQLPENMQNQQHFGLVWIMGNIVIKVALHPYERARHIFHKYCFEEDETCVFGFGIYDVIQDMQNLANSSIRAAIDNASITSGPQVEVNVDLLDKSAVPDANELTPWKVWLRTGKGDDAGRPAIRVYDAGSHIADLIKLFELFKLLLDEVSTIPSYMHGEKDAGVGDTVGGLSMLMGAANLTIKDVISNYDDGITKPYITGMYDWEMMYGKEDVRGDYNIKATGSTSLVAKEVRANAIGQFETESANPIDAAFTNRQKILKYRAEALDLPEDVVLSDDEARQVQETIIKQAAGMIAQAYQQMEQAKVAGALPGPDQQQQQQQQGA